MEYNPRYEGGRLKTEGLFYELCQNKAARDECPFTIKEYDYKGRPSLYLLYMQCVDEWDFISKHLNGSTTHWEKLCETHWFMEGRPEHNFKGLRKWREDIRMRDESLAKSILMQEARDGNVTAAKALGDLSKGFKKAGRPKGATKESSQPIDSVADFLAKKKEKANG